ncbi:ABC transporter permease subunit [Leucobacter soli]|uniref:ABC transporter permease subunit n=1 Tax=Leucobacter soli TaxID=2812850 RepID=UPI0036084210
MIIIASFGNNPIVLVVSVSLVFAPRVGRLARASTHQVVVRDYIQAAEARGESLGSVLFREVMPNIAGPMIADTALRLTYAVVFVASLNFLGLGEQPPSSDWGLAVSAGREYVMAQPWAVVAPAAAIAVLSFQSISSPKRSRAKWCARRRGHRCEHGPRYQESIARLLDRGRPAARCSGCLYLGRSGNGHRPRGESGCGKSTLALAALGYGKPGVKVVGGEVLFQGKNLIELPAQSSASSGARVSLMCRRACRTHSTLPRGSGGS